MRNYVESLVILVKIYSFVNSTVCLRKQLPKKIKFVLIDTAKSNFRFS